jgi:plasmid maintenance system antidote protein VapI
VKQRSPNDKNTREQIQRELTAFKGTKLAEGALGYVLVVVRSLRDDRDPRRLAPWDSISTRQAGLSYGEARVALEQALAVAVSYAKRTAVKSLQSRQRTPAPDRPFEPDWASPPGDTVQELIQHNGISRTTLGEALHLSQPELDELLSGQRELSCANCLELEELLGVPASFWVKLEAQYRRTLSRISHGRSKNTTIRTAAQVAAALVAELMPEICQKFPRAAGAYTSVATLRLEHWEKEVRASVP